VLAAPAPVLPLSGRLSGQRPERGSTVASGRDTAHDGGMHPTPLRDGALAVRASRGMRFDLEQFWPSRRSHAYDEFCR
jgi:hypothetical protein